VQAALRLLRHVSRFSFLVKRLVSQYTDNEQEILKAAITVSEIGIHNSFFDFGENLVSSTQIKGIAAVDAELAGIAKIKENVTRYAYVVLDRGFNEQNQSTIAYALQVFYNMRTLAEKIRAILNGFMNKFVLEIGKLLDMDAINKEIQAQGTSSSAGIRRKNEPVVSSSQAAHWQSALWDRMEKLMDFIYGMASKIYLLDRVLARKRDPFTRVSFLEIVVKDLDGGLIQSFWKTLSATFEKEIRNMTKSMHCFLRI